MNTEPKLGASTAQHKTSTISYPFTKALYQKRLMKKVHSGHKEQLIDSKNDSIVSRVVKIVVKRNKFIKIALDSRKLDAICIKVESQALNMEELI